MMSTSTINFHTFKNNKTIRRYMNRYKTIRDKLIKIKATITFLIRCRNAGIIPKFIKNATKNVSNLFHENDNLPAYRQKTSNYVQELQNKILNTRIRYKHEQLKEVKKECRIIEDQLQNYFGEVEYASFLEYEDKLASNLNEKIKCRHKQKFQDLVNLQRRELGIKFNCKWFVNKSNINIPIEAQWVLSLGHKHMLPTEREHFPVLKIITEGEDLVQTLRKKEEQEIARTKLTTSIDNHVNKMRLTNRDKFILDKVKKTDRFLRSNRDIIILNADKGNTTVAMNRTDYELRINDIIRDDSNYRRLDKDPTNKLEKMNNNLVQELFINDIITITERNKFKTNTAMAPRLYGLPKIHKMDFPLRPICSMINSPSYELCKYITRILNKITENSKYNVKDSLQFKDRIKNFTLDNNERLISLDVVSLFPSIPIDLAINIIEEKWNIIRKHTNMEKDLFLRILKFCIIDSRYFQLNNHIYNQMKGLPMGSSASPIVADIVMERLLDICVEKLIIKPKILTKYVDDLFCIISESGIEQMLDIFNSFHADIKFTIERESNSRISYLDTLIIRRGNRILIDWYQKPTSSGRIINYFSKHPKRIIINTAKNFIERVLKISDSEFHGDNKKKISNILTDNSFPKQLVTDLLIRHDNYRINNRNSITEQRIYKSVTYIPKFSERLEKSNIYDNKIYKIAHKSFNTVGKLFTKMKDKIKRMDMSNIVYKIPCKGNDSGQCNKVYIGTTKNKLKTRIAGHKSDQRYRNISQKTALSTHCANLNHYPDFENTTVLNTENNYKRRFMLEMLQIIKVPTISRINFKSDTENVAQNYRHLIYKNRNGS